MKLNFFSPGYWGGESIIPDGGKSFLLLVSRACLLKDEVPCDMGVKDGHGDFVSCGEGVNCRWARPVCGLAAEAGDVTETVSHEMESDGA